MPVPHQLFDVYANRSTESATFSTPLLHELMRGVDTKTVPWKVEGPAADQQPPRLWVNCWRHNLYARGRGREGNSATVCHLVNYKLNMSAPLNATGGLVIPTQSTTVWVRGEFTACSVYSPTRNTTTLRLQRRNGMVGAILPSMDEYAIIAFGSSSDSANSKPAGL